MRWKHRVEKMPKRAMIGTPRRRVRQVTGAVVVLLAAASTACARSDEDRIRRQKNPFAALKIRC